MNWLGELIQTEITEKDTVLDLGCGIMIGYDELKYKSILGVDIWAKYLDNIKHKKNTVMLGMTDTHRFMDDSYDVVICLDVVEHLDYDLALKVLDECKRICRKKAIVFTPIEFKPNHQNEGGAWNLGDNVFQNHLCVVSKNDMQLRGYNVTKQMGEGWLGIYKS